MATSASKVHKNAPKASETAARPAATERKQTFVVKELDPTMFVTVKTVSTSNSVIIWKTYSNTVESIRCCCDLYS